MVEVFKTNVTQRRQARMLLARIHQTFSNCKANFDLDDCDKILRIFYVGEDVNPKLLISLIKKLGFHAEVLAHRVPEARHALIRDISNNQLYKAI